MRLTDSDIISTARDLRDEQNARLQVKPNPLKRSNNRSIPLWWAATAAALIIGFVAGRHSPASPPAPPAREGAITLADEDSNKSGLASAPSLAGGARGEATIIREVIHDTIFQTRIVHVPVPQVMTAQAEPVADPEPETPGCSMLCDDIPYELLANN
ncbi:MAG: hypothetical protein ILA06_04665 [Bacteroidaceae bacterium]|nr:hypothetical protein [Bacteroidaceae bacterium]